MTDLQSTNRVKISKVREASFGVVPTNPVFKTRRVTSHGLAVNPQTVVSEEIRADRQVSDLVLVGLQAGGPSAGEMAFSVMDEDLEEALEGTWSNTPDRDNAGVADSVVTAVATTNTEVTHLTGAAFVASQLVLFSGFGVAGNNGVFKCTTGGATTSRYVGSGITDEAAPAAAARMKVVGFRGASGDLVAVTVGGNALTSTLLDFTTLGLVVGQWVRPAGFATAADNDFVRISAIAANRLSFDRVPAGWVADAGIAVVIDVYQGDVLTNASVLRSTVHERQYLEHSPVSYEYLTGQALDKMAFNLPSGAIATYTEEWMGAAGYIASARVSGATDIAAPTNDVMNGASNIGRVGFDGAVVIGPNFVQSATLAIANNLRRQLALGSEAAVGVGKGEFTVTGTMNTYFGDKTVLDKLLNNSLTSFDFRIGRTDSNNETLLFDLPAIKLSAGAPSVSGKNQDVMLPANFQAIAHRTLGYTMLVERFWYLP